MMPPCTTDAGAMRRAHAVAAMAIALLAGCAIGPDYVRPKVDAPAAFRFEPAQVAATANTAWWKQFNDPVLDQLIDTALANNLNVKIAAANVEQAAAIITQTRSQLFPQIGYAATGERARIPDTGIVAAIPNYPNPQNAYQALLTATWEIDLWGRIRRLSESAQANMLATDEARRGVILTLVNSVATDYLTLRGLDEQLAIAKATLGTYGESVKLYQLQFKYGQTSQMTVSQAQSQYETAAAQIPLIESQIAQTRERAVGAARPQSGPDPARQVDLRSRAAERPRRRALRAARAPARPHAGRADADRRQRADRRREGALLPGDLADRRARQLQHRALRPVQGADARLELRGPGRRPDLHVRRRQRAGGAGGSRRSRRRCSTTSSRSRTRSPTSTTRSSPARS